MRWRGKSRVSAAEIVDHPLIGIDPNDPYGRIMAGIFAQPGALLRGHDPGALRHHGVRPGRTNGLGIAVIDEFTLAGGNWPGVVALAIGEPTEFQTYVAFRKDATLSSYCEHFVASLRQPHGSAWRAAGAQGTSARRPRKVTSG